MQNRESLPNRWTLEMFQAESCFGTFLVFGLIELIDKRLVSHVNHFCFFASFVLAMIFSQYINLLVQQIKICYI
jgi:hypothetical protein